MSVLHLIISIIIRTALAEAELEYDNNFTSPSVYVRFSLDKLPPTVQLDTSQKLFALIWTTTPWTLPSNQAICFNSNLKYSLVETKSKKDLYIIASNLVEDFVRTSKIECEIKGSFDGKSRMIKCCRNMNK